MWDCVVRNEARSGALGGIRTPDTWFRRPVLYPLSYERPDVNVGRAHFVSSVFPWVNEQ